MAKIEINSGIKSMSEKKVKKQLICSDKKQRCKSADN